jgi:TPR repeat protein
MRSFFVFLCSILALSCVAMTMARAQEQEQTDKIALVIGNQNYAHLTVLKNAVADADLMAGSLEDVGFEVVLIKDGSKADMGRAIVDFRRRIQPGTIAVVYYAGHGMQANDENYLVPVDAELKDAQDLPWMAIGANDLVKQFEATAASALVFILDACRDNPFWNNEAKTRSIGGAGSRGLARIISNRAGTLIAFSTAPGAVAQDGDGVNSPYTSALAEAIREPGQSLETIFKRARVKVVEETKGRQIPWENSSLVTDIVLQPRPGERAIIQATPCDLAAAHPADPERVGPSVEYANLDPSVAIPACEAAVAAEPDVMRFKTLLARALDKAGRGDEAARLNEIAMRAGSLAGYHNMGNLYRKGLGVEKDQKKAFELFLYAAERGHVEDQSNVGVMYMQGQGVEKDFAQAMRWLMAASEQNWGTAADKIGLLHLDGKGVEKNIDKALEFFEKGVNLGDRNSMVNLANLYMKGIGVEADAPLARDLFMRAARLGAVAAYINLGNIYASGQGIEADPVEAALFFTLASREGRDDALEKLRDIRKTLTEQQLEDLDQRLELWTSHRYG